MTKIVVGIRLPSVASVELNQLRAFVQRIEASPVESLWAGDHIFHTTQVLSPLNLLGWIGGFTSRLRLGTSVINAAYLHPVLLAKEAATVDYLSGGRLSLGVSIGGSDAEYTSLGIRQSERVGRLAESIALMRRLWSEDGVEHAGRYFRVTQANLRPKPVQTGGIPVLLAARSETMLRRIPTLADGWIASSHYSTADFARGIHFLRDCAARSGRDPETISIAKVHDVSVHRDHDDARRRAEEHWRRYYGTEHDIDASTTYGTPAECVAQLSSLKELGSSRIRLILEPTSYDLEELGMLLEVSSELNEAP